MFQPQPTPYASFSSYGAANDQDPDHSAYSFQSAGLGLRSGGPIVFDPPVFSPVPDFRASSLSVAQNRYGTMNTPPPDDMAAQEALARAYQPDLKGPLVGEKKSSMAITDEYAKADPIYVAKTSTLPHTYSHYRQVKGDGNCGWRAIGFSYFETLVKLGDKKLVQEESERMMGLSDFVVNMCGHEVWIFEDMRDECLNLLGDIMGLISLAPHPDANAVILERFNNAEVSDGIVYWLRLLASAYLRAHAASFQDFIPELIGVDNYCKDVLEPTNNEIEHLGMTLLVDVLLAPIGISVEIVYLDRSEGTHVNTHFFGRENSNAPRAAIYLLYRPGHYDILYKDLPTSRAQSISQQQILEHATTSPDLQVNRATNFAHRHSIQETPANYQGVGVDFNLLASMPSVFGPLSPSHGYPEPCTTTSDFSHSSYAPSYVDPSVRASSISPTSSVSPPPSQIYTPKAGLPIHPAHNIPLSPEPLSPGPLSPTRSMAHPLSPPPLPNPSASVSQFRPSLYQYKEDWGSEPAQGFQTSTFKNSHYNVSHYNNPNFQPEQWTPDCDEAVGRITRRGTS